MTIVAVWTALCLLCAVMTWTVLAWTVVPKHQYPHVVAKRLARRALARTRDRVRDREDRPTW